MLNRKEMKKYVLISIVAALFFGGCVKDEQPEPAPPAPENYDDIVINELITKDITDPYFISGNGDNADWIELYNKGNKAVDVGGMWVTDNPGTETDYQQIPRLHPNVTTIPPKGFLVLICGAKDAGGVNIPTSIIGQRVFIGFGLSSSKDSYAAIYTPEKKEVNRSGNFNGLEDDKSAGRLSDGDTSWVVLANKTPGASNDGSAPEAGKLVINEFMASNDSWDVPGDNGDQPDWFEIYNTGDTPIDMGGWYVTDALDDPAKYQLPTDNADLTTVPAHGFLVIICDGVGEGLHASFKLSGGGEEVGISQDGVTITEGYSYCDTGCDLPNPGTDNSTGRDGDGNAAWIVFEKDSNRPPTPGASNGSGK